MINRAGWALTIGAGLSVGATGGQFLFASIAIAVADLFLILHKERA